MQLTTEKIKEMAESKYQFTTEKVMPQTARMYNEVVIQKRNAYIAAFNDCLKLMGEEWVSVKDRLPEQGDKVLIFFGAIDNILIATVGSDYDGNVIFFGYYRDSYSCDHAEDITHWKPLPTPPNP